MAKINIFIVFTLSLFFPFTIGRLCNLDQYYDKGKKDCVQCPACPKGTQYTNNCGYNENGELTGKQCEDCTLGLTYKDKTSTERCDNCGTCGHWQIEKPPCTLTSNTVCVCRNGTYRNKYGVCRKISTKTPVTSPATTPIVTTTTQLSTQSEEPKHNGTQVKTPIVTTKTQLPTQSEEPKHNGTEEPSTTVLFKSSQPYKAQQKDTNDRPFPQTGWIILFCLLGFLVVTAFIFLSCHKRTRKLVSGFCCRKYCVLWPDHDSSDREVTYDLMRAEGHYEEQQAATPTNNAEPIPPWKEPALQIVKSSSTPEQVYCSCMTKDIDSDKIRCACTLTTSDPSIDQMGHTSSSAESVSEELQYYYKGMKQGIQTPARKSSPSPSSSSGVFSSRSSDQCHPISPRVTPTPPRGVSPDHYCAASTSASSSTCVTPHRWSAVHHCVTMSSPSTCETPHLPRGLSPECCCMTSSSASTSPVVTSRSQSPDLYCVTSSSNPSSTCVTPLRERSPDPSIPSIQVQVADEQEVSNQSNECSHIPISIEASDKKHDISKAKSSITSSPAAKNKRTDSKHAGKRNSLSPTKEPLCACQRELHLKSHWPIDPSHCKETVEREKVVPDPVPNGNKNTESTARASVGNDLKMEDEMEDRKMKTNVTVYNQGGCKYRPINRDEGTEHRCPACCPLPSDSFFKLINRERLCLKEEICKQLNSSFRELAILGRVDSEMQEYEASSNPAERVLERLNASHPDLKLAEFEEMLHKIKRKDIVGVLYDHHLSCTLCQRNKFDTKA